MPDAAVHFLSVVGLPLFMEFGVLVFSIDCSAGFSFPFAAYSLVPCFTPGRAAVARRSPSRASRGGSAGVCALLAEALSLESFGSPNLREAPTVELVLGASS